MNKLLDEQLHDTFLILNHVCGDPEVLDLLEMGELRTLFWARELCEELSKALRQAEEVMYRHKILARKEQHGAGADQKDNSGKPE